MKVPQLHVGAGTALGPLSIFPIWSAARGELGISTGTHANVAVNELPSGAQVGKLVVTNNGPRPALLLEGELLEGGQQHRTCAQDVVLGSGETRTIETYCVEAGRWQAGKKSHHRLARRAPLNVRAELTSRVGIADASDRQSRIWNRVSRFDAARGASATSSLVEHLERPVSPRFEATAAAPMEGQRGVLIGLGTQPLLLEMFGTHTMFLRHYRQLVDSALLDLELLPAQVLNSGSLSGQRARDFAALAQEPTMGTFDGGPLASTRNHGSLRSRPLKVLRGALEGAGTAVEIPGRQPEVAHLTLWNTQHPFMKMA
ncbi:ARPP-1 family domain-containing protein [Paenarthrobacter sp. NCHU4564]|uniref:ARPP-1 family domain-containing protein n=1 Tax=Paenarthrobacter sp. NCHU4564 TaxID=3451353 RepID=UPI003F953A8B